MRAGAGSAGPVKRSPASRLRRHSSSAGISVWEELRRQVGQPAEGDASAVIADVADQAVDRGPVGDNDLALLQGAQPLDAAPVIGVRPRVRRPFART
jgi:hypothetical protein